MRHIFSRRNNRGENQGGKRLGGKRKFYACMWGEQAMKKIDAEWKGSSLDKDDVVRKQRRELTCWNKKGKEERGAVHKTPNLSASERRAGLAKSSRAIFWQNHKTHTTPYLPFSILQKNAEISRVMVITQICYFSRFDPMYSLNQWHGSAERLILHSKELLARATKSTVVLVRSNMTFQCNPHFWNDLYQSLPSLNQPRQEYEVTFHEKCYLHLAEVNNFPKVYMRICMPFTID